VAARILVVEDDTFVQTVISDILLAQGHEVHTATDGTTALAAAMIHPPDLVISDVMMPGMDGWALVRRVRSHPRLAFVPFIFLSSLNSLDDVLRGFRLGADDYLPKPFSPEALLERVAHALRWRSRIADDAHQLFDPDQLFDPHDGGDPPTGIRGSLAVVGLSSLLVLLDLEKKGGTLELKRSAPQERCRLLIYEGRVFQAYIDLGPPLAHAEVIYYLLGWPHGSFEFHPSSDVVHDEIECSTTGLLMEAARRADELVLPMLPNTLAEATDNDL
jgi:CheY-like chemotaxis protein